MELPICECATEWPGQGHHPECPVRREIERLRTVLADATERAEVQTHRSARLLEAAQIMGSERDAAIARADALAARLAEVDGEHPA